MDLYNVFLLPLLLLLLVLLLLLFLVLLVLRLLFLLLLLLFPGFLDVSSLFFAFHCFSLVFVAFRWSVGQGTGAGRRA